MFNILYLFVFKIMVCLIFKKNNNNKNGEGIPEACTSYNVTITH